MSTHEIEDIIMHDNDARTHWIKTQKAVQSIFLSEALLMKKLMVRFLFHEVEEVLIHEDGVSDTNRGFHIRDQSCSSCSAGNP